ncbi:MAG: hypothetical protein DDT27_01362 [Dehalococcoidia bacterium]|nr:hypothetical protein [Chloroflexota bacterium]
MIKMLHRQRKSECHRIREMISPYLDDCVTPVERDAVKYHVEICEGCEWELRSLGITVQLLSRMPAPCAPRSFTLAEAPRRRISFAIPSMNRLRLATALAVVLLAVLLAGDFSGLFYADISGEPAEAAGDRVHTDIAEPENIAPALPGETPAPVAEDPAEEIAGMPEAEEPPPSPTQEDRRIAQQIEPGLEWELTAPLAAEVPEAVLPIREPYPWLLPLQIASAALVLVLGGANLLVWQRRRDLSLLGRG